ncbi:hypothetical protein [Haloferula rosea]|uniref:Peptidase C39-like domain-containing protein n=1 Tax=Haloferula rosea TaxID=490093 RepID=A0A934RCM9_9BACT|nr:hypothetical protein [Haloferula rosea]MBK1826005.1 hypothetical protein [Haloferula rosea]
MFTLLRNLHRLLILVSLVAGATADDRWAPNAVAGPVNQLDIAGNACGPAALLTSFRCGDESWTEVATAIPGSSDKAKLLYMIRAHGLRPSTSLKDRKRWTREGVNVEDLNSIAGELSALAAKPSPKLESLLLTGRESPEKLVGRVHSRMRNSLKNGFPPVISLRRYVFRKGQWQALQTHFVTIVRVPDRIPRRTSNFDFTYFDPWGGKKETGWFLIPTKPLLAPPSESSPCLETNVPKANIGKAKVHRGERTAVVPTFLIGRW